MCERYIDQFASHMLQPGAWPATQACALTQNETGDPSARGMMPNPRSHISQGRVCSFLLSFFFFSAVG